MWAVGIQRHRFSELRREFLAPGAGGDQQALGAELATVGGGHRELAGNFLHLGDFSLFLDPRPEAAGSPGKRRRGQTRVGVAIVGRIGTALHVRPEERKALVQLGATIDLQIQLRRLGRCRIGFQFGNFILAVTHAHVPAGDELEVVVDQLWQAFPQRPGTVGQFQLTEEAPLPPDVAEIDAAGVLTNLVALQQNHRLPALAQEKRRRRAHQAAANNHYIGFV